MSEQAALPAKADQVDHRTGRVAVVYAQALLGAAEASGATDAVVEEFDSFVGDVLDGLPRLESVLASALVGQDDKLRLIERGFRGTASALFLNFLKVLVQHDRLDLVRAIHRATLDQYDQLRGRVRVVVTTADPVGDGESQAIARLLTPVLRGTPVLELNMQPDLIGGLVLRIGDTVYDGSIAAQFQRVRDQMIDRSVHEIQSRRDRFRTATGD